MLFWHSTRLSFAISAGQRLAITMSWSKPFVEQLTTFLLRWKMENLIILVSIFGVSECLFMNWLLAQRHSKNRLGIGSEREAIIDGTGPYPTRLQYQRWLRTSWNISYVKIQMKGPVWGRVEYIISLKSTSNFRVRSSNSSIFDHFQWLYF